MVTILEIIQTLKVKLKLQNSEDTIKLTETCEQYRFACNFVSHYVFHHQFELGQSKLNEVLYTSIRKNYQLKSQLAQSVLKTVIARYKTVRTQLRKQKVKGTSEYKDLDFLWYPIHFRRPQADLVRNRDYSYLSNGTLSINTLQGRIKATPIYKGLEHYFDGTWL